MLQTERLLLRRWCDSDREPFAAMESDPQVRRYFESIRTRAECDAWIDRVEGSFETHGFGRWVVEVPGITAFAGILGLAVPPFKSHFTPCVEIGWRLAAEYWNRGYATEGAREVLRFGFEDLNINEIVAFTVVDNMASRRVMEKLGMTHNPADDFDYPLLPEGHPLRRQVLYRITQGNFERLQVPAGSPDHSRPIHP